ISIAGSAGCERVSLADCLCLGLTAHQHSTRTPRRDPRVSDSFLQFPNHAGRNVLPRAADENEPSFERENRMTRILKTVAGLTIAVIFPNLLATAADTFTLPAGSTLRVRLGTGLSSKETETGDQFTGDVAEPIISGGEEVVPTGSTIQGRVLVIKQAGRGKTTAELRLTPESITTPAGLKYFIVIAPANGEVAGNVKAKGNGKS